MNKKIFYGFLLFIFSFSVAKSSNAEANLKNYTGNKLKYTHLNLEVSKDKFSPNGDNIDDIIELIIIVPKNRKWTIFISSLNDKEIIEDGIFGTEDLTKIITGIGTSKEQKIIWDGRSTNKILLSQGDYEIELKSDKQTINRKVFLAAPERITEFQMSINSNPDVSDKRIIQIKRQLHQLNFESISEMSKNPKNLKSRR